MHAAVVVFEPYKPSTPSTSLVVAGGPPPPLAALSCNPSSRRASLTEEISETTLLLMHAINSSYNMTTSRYVATCKLNW